MEQNYVKVLRLNDLNTLVIRQSKGSNFFLTSDDGVIITIQNLSHLLKYLVFNGIISPKVLEGILSEYYEFRE